MTDFDQIRWASDPGQIASRFRAYRRLVGYRRRVLPFPTAEVDDEETRSDLDAVRQRPLD